MCVCVGCACVCGVCVCVRCACVCVESAKSYFLTIQTRNSAIGKGNKNPERMLREILPGIAKVCKLFTHRLRNIEQEYMHNALQQHIHDYILLFC